MEYHFIITGQYVNRSGTLSMGTLANTLNVESGTTESEIFQMACKEYNEQNHVPNPDRLAILSYRCVPNV